MRRLSVLPGRGQASYHGDQDNDPNNNADCNASPRATEVHVAEVQVFGQTATVGNRIVPIHTPIGRGPAQPALFVSGGPAMLARP
jgi:hypothetical protein